jgi:AcrR family transcriptional regulator
MSDVKKPVAYARAMPEAKRSSYHHGALREELLEACVRLVGSEGVGAVSLRRVAREAGVSPGAPYHHFADRAALIAAISTQGFELLGDALRTAREGASGPRAALIVMAVAYVEFARRHTAYFQLMFRPELSQPDKHPDTQKAGDAAFDTLAEVVAECGAADPEGMTLSVWAFAHGLASLAIDGQLDRGKQWSSAPDELIQRALRFVDSILE